MNAGKYNKFENLNSKKPKCLLEIEGNSLLEIQINTLHNCGIDDITVVTGYGAEYIDIPGVKYYNNKNYENTNVLYSLFCAREEINDDVLILYGDVIFEEDTIKRMLESQNDITVGVMVDLNNCFKHKSHLELTEVEMITFDGENRVKTIGKNLDLNYDNSGMFTGIIKCSKRGAEILKNNYDRVNSVQYSGVYMSSKELSKAWITDLFKEMCNLGIPLYCVIIERGWLEINDEEDYKRALVDTEFVRRLVKVKTDWKVRSETYDKISWVNRDETLNEMINFANNVNEKNVLDLGTGTGKVLKTLKAQYPKGIYYGVDISEGMMSKIGEEYGFDLRVSKIEDLKTFQSNFFNIVTARMVLHHSEDLDKAIEEVYRILKPGGKFIICEGNPPDRYSCKFYEEMFKFKEDRHTFLLDDITNLLVNHNFSDITSKTIVLNNMSLNNWLNNAGVPFRNIDIIRKMHYEADPLVKKAYGMKNIEDDIIMNWKFSVVCGVKKD